MSTIACVIITDITLLVQLTSHIMYFQQTLILYTVVSPGSFITFNYLIWYFQPILYPLFSVFLFLLLFIFKNIKLLNLHLSIIIKYCIFMIEFSFIFCENGHIFTNRKEF